VVFFPLFEALLVKKGIDTYTPQPKKKAYEVGNRCRLRSFTNWKSKTRHWSLLEREA